MPEAVKVTAEMVQQLLPTRTDEEWKALREQFLARGYQECSLCPRLVSPAFVRFIEGLGNVAMCPDRQGRHAGRLGPTRLQALLRAYAQAKPVEPDPEPTPQLTVVDLDPTRDGREA
jgi:hypothetical protein